MLFSASKEEWDAQHQVCPECGSDDFEKTCMCWLIGTGYYDPNRARCLVCGWSGKCEDLVPQRETSP